MQFYATKHCHGQSKQYNQDRTQEQYQRLLQDLTFHQNKLYGYVNANAEVVVPVVFENVDWAKKAYQKYKDLPASTFTEVDIYRVRLHHTLRERTYELNSVIPNSDWDY